MKTSLPIKPSLAVKPSLSPSNPCSRSLGVLRQLLQMILLVAGVCVPGQVLALEDDRAQPIRITADRASRDERAGETRYEGNVMLSQGSLQINADSVTVQHTTEQANTIVATGSPATLTQIPNPEQAAVNAEAGRIEYWRDLEKITLTENARIEQDGATVTGVRIDYLVAEQRVQASGEAGDGQRVEVVIPPSALNEES